LLKLVLCLKCFLLTPQGSAADVAMCAMLEIDRNTRLKELGWTLLLQVFDV
jgi:DNA polymerase I-like protein with 3'-5' exonuclease and polymerase domains